MKRPLSSFIPALATAGVLALAPAAAHAQLTLGDVQKIISQAISRAEITRPNALIAVTDREGFVIGVWSVNGDPQPDSSRVGAAISEAGTPTFLSTNENAFSTRTAKFLIQQNFPPGIDNRSPGPLVGIAFSQLPFSDANRFKRVFPGPFGEVAAKPGGAFVPGSLGTGIYNTRLSGRASGFPLYKNGQLVGGIGVYSGGNDDLQQAVNTELNNSDAPRTEDETLARTGQIGFAPRRTILGSNVFIDGLGLPYTKGTAKLGKVKPIGTVGAPVNGFGLSAALPEYPLYPVLVLGGRPVVIRSPLIDDPLLGVPINGQARLNAAEIAGIVGRVAARAFTTRSAIKNPIGTRAEIFVSVVGLPAGPGQPAPILVTARTFGSALFDANDVCPQKARTAVFFSSDAFAASTRTVGFLAQNHYPPGLNIRAPGPYGPENPQFNPDGSVIATTVGYQVASSVNIGPFPNDPSGTPRPFIPVALPQPPDVPLATTIPPNPNLPDGINLFGGGFPLYRNGVLIGGVGSSGDGIEVDDLLGASGVGAEFACPDAIRADQFTFDGARLPYAKFPRNPDI